ncbi:trace amine-associated receptor 4-like [Venturia canescens]|uniref:trace amine-associated receptor 4-like n=1 Tax=Venturia canescens TaxID=32260 RepID=UPI001C9BF271|nr:trace amine-associated receptor 4-like [Venturia canescens]
MENSLFNFENLTASMISTYENQTSWKSSPRDVENIVTSDESVRCDRYSDRMRLSYLYGTPPLIVFCIISVVINIKTLMSAGWIRRPLSPTLHISLSLAGADAFSSTALAIGLLMNSFIPKGLCLRLSDVGCFLLSLEAIRLGGVMITVGHLVALGVNHYLGIVKPLQYLTIMTHRITSFLIILLWILPLLFFFTYFSVIEDEGFQSLDCGTHTFLFKRKFRMMFSSLFFAPFLLMVCIYFHIFCIVRKHQASRLRFRRAGSSFRRNDGDKTEREEHSASQQMARNVKAINTTLFILGSFVIGWMPATFLYIFVCEDCPLKFDWIDDEAKFFINIVSNCLIILKTLINPIIYAARMHEIQIATKRMHSSLCCFRATTNNSEERNRTHSSEGAFIHRFSFSRRTIRRINGNNENKKREEIYKYTYQGIKGFSRPNTFV